MQIEFIPEGQEDDFEDPVLEEMYEAVLVVVEELGKRHKDKELFYYTLMADLNNIFLPKTK